MNKKNMKKVIGFTLIELLAVIVILAIIALISTPIIIGVIEKARKGSFENTAYGVYDAATLYFTDKLADDNKFAGKIFDFRENTDDLKISGEKPKEGYVSIDQNGVVSLAISNDNWCTRIDAGNKKATTTNGKCAEKSLKETIEGDTSHIVKNVKVNGETVNKVKGTKDEKLTMKNYVWYSGQLWQVMETNDTKHTIKLITAQSLTSIAYGNTNDFNTSWVKKWLNDDKFYPILENKEYIVESDFCADEPDVASTQITNDGHNILSLTSHTQISTCTNKVKTKVGLMTFEDYAYAQNGNSASYLGGSFLDEDEFQWTMTPYTKGGKSNQMWVQWYTNGYLAVKVNSVDWSLTNSGGLGVRPVINMKDTVMIESGTGTKKDPYVLFGEKKVGENAPINNVKVGDYVYLDESKNPYTFNTEYVTSDLSFNTTKDKVRYRVVSKEGNSTVKVERADVLRSLPNTIAINNSGIYVPYYYSSTCGHINDVWQTSGCMNHNMFLPNDGAGDYKYSDSENIAYFLNNATNSFYSWYSDKTKNMIEESNWDLFTSGHEKDYSSLNDNSGATTYPSRTNDGKVKVNVALPSWGDMYTGNDLNIGYWFINRLQHSSSNVTLVSNAGCASILNAGEDWIGVRPVIRLKESVKISSGSGTMTNPYSLTI